jgi:drug/metabolite transporter (DMT)-like permease
MPTALLVLIVTLVTIGSQLILKRGIGEISTVLRQEGAVAFVWAAATSPIVLAALLLQGIGYVVWWFVVSQERLSVAFAISGSFFYLVMAGASWLLYGERLNIQQWIGLCLITAGVLMVNLFKDV